MKRLLDPREGEIDPNVLTSEKQITAAVADRILAIRNEFYLTPAGSLRHLQLESRLRDLYRLSVWEVFTLEFLPGLIEGQRARAA